jgi:hypothetical protein
VTHYLPLPVTTYQSPLITHQLPFTIYQKVCKTNPIPKNTQINVSPVSTMAYNNMGPSATRKTNPKRTQNEPKANPIFRSSGAPKAKTNPNKPKQSQSDPHFSPVRGTQSQNEPKQTQSKANLSRRSRGRGRNKPAFGGPVLRFSAWVGRSSRWGQGWRISRQWYRYGKCQLIQQYLRDRPYLHRPKQSRRVRILPDG